MKFNGNDVNSTDLMKLIQAVKANIMKDLNVAEIGIVKSIKNNEYMCELLNSPNELLPCLAFANNTYEVGSIVLIVFTNYNSKINLSRLLHNQPTISNSSYLHSKNNGLIVCSMTTK